MQPQLAETTRACAYDRAGLGNSPPIPGVHDAGDEIADLQRLLHVAHLQPPYALGGRSYGGMLVRPFAREHPDETAGVVLVDARGRNATRRQLAIWPKREAPAIRRAVFRPVQRGVDLATREALVSRVRSLGDTPLAVITAARHDEWARVGSPQLARALDRLWSTMQDELAALSTEHVHVVAVCSDHFVQRQLDGSRTLSYAPCGRSCAPPVHMRAFRSGDVCSAEPTFAAASRTNGHPRLSARKYQAGYVAARSAARARFAMLIGAPGVEARPGNAVVLSRHSERSPEPPLAETPAFAAVR